MTKFDLGWTTRLLLLLLTFTSNLSAAQQRERVMQTAAGHMIRGRQPRFFSVSTSTVTKTSSTTTQCFISSSSLAACKKRKRRFIRDDIIEGLSKLENLGRVKVSSSFRDPKEGDEGNVLKSNKDTERKAKFILYWTTSKSTTTSYTYTATSKVASLACTPSGFALSVCGG